VVDDRSRDLLKRLSEVYGICGHEDEVRAIFEEAAAGLGPILKDKHGGVAVEKRGSSDRPRVLLAGHMDEIGFLVKSITDEGYLYLLPVGGWVAQVLPAQRVSITGSKGAVLGVIGAKPPHLTPAEKRNEMVPVRDMFVDVGAMSREEVTEGLGILPGDPVTPVATFEELNGGKFLLGKAWDDRVGVALAIDTVRNLGDGHPNVVYAAGTIVEEKGLIGAASAAWLTEPDVAIVLEVGITGGMPGVDGSKEASEKCGSGVSIVFVESGALPSRRLRAWARKVAQEEEIPFQDSFYEAGGSDGHAITRHKTGVPYLLLTVPARYIHTHNQLIASCDYDAALRLCVALCRRLDSATLAELLP
jgi:endoglucanase